MALNMGEGDLRGLSPGGAKLAGRPRPFLAHPSKSRPAPCTGVRLGPRGAQPRAAQRVRPPGSQRSGGRRLLPARSSGMGALRNPSPAASRTMHRGSGWALEGSGAPLCRVRVLWTTASPGPLQRLHREGSGPREPRSSPAPRKPRVGFETDPHSSLPGRGLESAQPRQPARTTTQTFFRPLFSSKLGIHGDRAWQPDSPTA